jgi:cystathionine gamma-lyase
MCLRSLKTLAIRMQAHEQNALVIAQFLERHKKIEKVMYPGLESHPQHTLAQEQMSGFGGMLSFYVKGGLEDASKLLQGTKLFILAESLGGVESLIEHPGLMTHASMSEEARLALGINDTLIRMSVGIETCDDLIRDLAQALN